MIRLGYIIFYVKDIQAALTFYEAAFELKTQFVHDSGTYAELATGETRLAFADEALGDSNLPGGYIRNDTASPPQASELAFITQDVEATYEKALTLGAIQVAPPIEKPWGQLVAYVRDPNGVLVEIASPLSP